MSALSLSLSLSLICRVVVSDSGQSVTWTPPQIEDLQYREALEPSEICKSRPSVRIGELRSSLDPENGPCGLRARRPHADVERDPSTKARCQRSAMEKEVERIGNAIRKGG